MARPERLLHDKTRAGLLALLLSVCTSPLKLDLRSSPVLDDILQLGCTPLAVTLLLVTLRVAARPADEQHKYGHAKAENIAILFSCILLGLNALWMAVDSSQCLFALSSGSCRKMEPNQVLFWGRFMGLTLSVGMFLFLKKSALRLESPLLATAALGFVLDALLSMRPLFLSLAQNADRLHLGEWLGHGVGSLVGCALVLYAIFRVILRSLNELMDSCPSEIQERLRAVVLAIEGVQQVAQLRVRKCGPDLFVEVRIVLKSGWPFASSSVATFLVERAIQRRFSSADVIVSLAPNGSRERG